MSLIGYGESSVTLGKIDDVGRGRGITEAPDDHATDPSTVVFEMLIPQRFPGHHGDLQSDTTIGKTSGVLRGRLFPDPELRDLIGIRRSPFKEGDTVSSRWKSIDADPGFGSCGVVDLEEVIISHLGRHFNPVQSRSRSGRRRIVRIKAIIESDDRDTASDRLGLVLDEVFDGRPSLGGAVGVAASVTEIEKIGRLWWSQERELSGLVCVFTMND